MKAIDDRHLKAAKEWLKSVRGEPLTIAIICPNLHLLPRFGRTKKLDSNAAQLQFLKEKNAVIDAVVNQRRSPQDIRAIANESDFRDFILVATTWHDVVELIARALQAGNNGSDRVGDQMWVAPGILAVNLWKEC